MSSTETSVSKYSLRSLAVVAVYVPFFLYLGHFAPHNPLQSLKKDYEKHSHMENHTLQVYAGMIEALDRSIGKILSALEKNGLTENTLIIFASDNGGAGYIGLDDINKPYRGWKLTHFEGGMHIPFFAKWPAKIKKDMKYNKRIHHTDIFSTILGAANIEPPKEIKIDGVNLIPFLTNQKSGEPHERMHLRSRRRKDAELKIAWLVSAPQGQQGRQLLVKLQQLRMWVRL